MSQNLKFTTAISGNTSQGLVLRNQKLEGLIKEADFVSTFFLSLVGRKPKDAEKTILNAILVSAIDHGINPASGFVPRVVASSGGDVLSAMAASLLAIGPYHGGAISAAMNIFKTINEEGFDIEKACNNLVDSYSVDKKRIPGFGHPVYKDFDPRAKELFDLARKNDMDIQFMNIAKQLEHSLDDKLSYKIKKKLILNIDGAIAALLLTIGIDSMAGNAIFGLARVAGSIAHIVEEQKSDKGVRRLTDEDVEYIST